MNIVAVQHERGPRNSTIRRQTANYHKKINDVNLPVCSSVVSPYWSLSCATATQTDVATVPFNATLLRHPVPQVIRPIPAVYFNVHRLIFYEMLRVRKVLCLLTRHRVQKKVPLYFLAFLVDFYNTFNNDNSNKYSRITSNLLI